MNDVIQKNHDMRDSIVGLERAIRDLSATPGFHEPDMPLFHVFAPGAYARTIIIPAGTLLVGKIHKHAHLNMLMQGHVLVATEEGPQHLLGPRVMCSKAGTKRVVYAYTDAVWTTVHLTDSTDLEEIEAQIIAKSYDAFDALQDAEVQQLLPVIQQQEEAL